MRLTEGLAGLVAEQLRPQSVAGATLHPRFKHFREAGEDPYRSFLGVPGTITARVWQLSVGLSILDGWWSEAYDGLNGFTIGTGATHTSTEIHDRRDGDSLLRVLTNEVIPLYYDRDRDGLPRQWIARVKRAIRTLGWRFSADRMVMDYVRHSYIPAAGGTSSDVNRS